MVAESAHRIIGGMFGLELSGSLPGPGGDAPPAFLRGQHHLLATARSGLLLLARSLAPPQIWLPSYLCSVIVEAIRRSGSAVRFYAIDANLRIPHEDWLHEVRAGDLVVFIDYFGFNEWSNCGAEAMRRGAWIVEDACQAMLNEQFCQHSHYVICSPRKFFGLPDGGVLLAHAGARLPGCELPPPPAEWWLEAFAASQLRAEFDRHGGDRKWFELFSKTDPAGPTEPFGMSELSALLLNHRIDCAEAARRRRGNYRFLAAELRDLAMFPDLPSGVVPLGFPVRLRDRDRVRHAMFRAEIYPPVHWPIAGVVPTDFKASHQLAAEIMTLPCDQRYTETEMSRMLDCLKAANPKSPPPA